MNDGRVRAARAQSPFEEAGMRYGYTLLIAAATVACLLASEARAQIPGQENPFTRSQRVWKVRDACARIAQKQFPDHTAEGNAKRERAFQQCLEGNNLPYESNTPKSSGGSSNR
jgi:hypothetical protein